MHYLHFMKALESTVAGLKPQLDELGNLAKDVLDYLSSSEVTSLSIQGDLSALSERYSR